MSEKSGGANDWGTVAKIFGKLFVDTQRNYEKWRGDNQQRGCWRRADRWGAREVPGQGTRTAGRTAWSSRGQGGTGMGRGTAKDRRMTQRHRGKNAPLGTIGVEYQVHWNPLPGLLTCFQFAGCLAPSPFLTMTSDSIVKQENTKSWRQKDTQKKKLDPPGCHLRPTARVGRGTAAEGTRCQWGSRRVRRTHQRCPPYGNTWRGRGNGFSEIRGLGRGWGVKRRGAKMGKGKHLPCTALCKTNTHSFW